MRWAKLAILAVLVVGMFGWGLLTRLMLLDHDKGLEEALVVVYESKTQLEALMAELAEEKLRQEELKCIQGLALVRTFGYEMAVVGEQVICARSWFISPVYGPEIGDNVIEIKPWEPEGER